MKRIITTFILLSAINSCYSQFSYTIGTYSLGATTPGYFGLAVDGSGNLYSAFNGPTYGGIIKSSVSGSSFILNPYDSLLYYADTIPRSVVHADLEPTCIALDASGNLYVGSDNYISKITPSGIIQIIAGRRGVP